jgi:hypothetical protein
MICIFSEKHRFWPLYSLGNMSDDFTLSQEDNLSQDPSGPPTNHVTFLTSTQLPTPVGTSVSSSARTLSASSELSMEQLPLLLSNIDIPPTPNELLATAVSTRLGDLNGNALF